jgi:hypothetical protein
MDGTTQTINNQTTNQHQQPTMNTIRDLNDDEIDEIHFNTRERSHKLALRKWLYKTADGSIPSLKK